MRITDILEHSKEDISYARFLRDLKLNKIPIPFWVRWISARDPDFIRIPIDSEKGKILKFLPDDNDLRLYRISPEEAKIILEIIFQIPKNSYNIIPDVRTTSSYTIDNIQPFKNIFDNLGAKGWTPAKIKAAKEYAIKNTTVPSILGIKKITEHRKYEIMYARFKRIENQLRRKLIMPPPSWCEYLMINNETVATFQIPLEKKNDVRIEVGYNDMPKIKKHTAIISTDLPKQDKNWEIIISKVKKVFNISGDLEVKNHDYYLSSDQLYNHIMSQLGQLNILLNSPEGRNILMTNMESDNILSEHKASEIQHARNLSIIRKIQQGTIIRPSWCDYLTYNKYDLEFPEEEVSRATNELGISDLPPGRISIKFDFYSQENLAHGTAYFRNEKVNPTTLKAIISKLLNLDNSAWHAFSSHIDSAGENIFHSFDLKRVFLDSLGPLKNLIMGWKMRLKHSDLNDKEWQEWLDDSI